MESSEVSAAPRIWTRIWSRWTSRQTEIGCRWSLLRKVRTEICLRQIFRGLVLLAMGSCEAFSPPFSRPPIEQRVERLSGVLGLRLSSKKAGGGKAKLKLIICQGSSCLGRCKGSFNPKDALSKLNNGASVELDEATCMNMCKKGPNVRLVLDGELITVQGKMNEVETKRKAFQSIGGDARVSGLWRIAQEVLRGELQTVPHGLPPVE